MRTRDTLSAVCLLAAALGGGAATTQSADIPFTRLTIDASPPSSPWYKMVGDINGDGQPDLIVAGSGGPLVWYAWPNWTKTQIATGGWGGVNGEAADVDGDGDVDIVMCGVVWFRNPRIGGGSWTMLRIDTEAGHDIEVGDFDRDGRLDVVSRNQSAFGGNGNQIFVYRQVNASTWSKRTLSCPQGEGLKVHDIDRDGDPDIVIGGRWYENSGDPVNGPWTERVYTTAWTEPDAKVEVGDYDADGRPDVVLSPAELAGQTSKIAWYQAPADARTGGWAERVVVSSIECVVHALAAGDFNRDGRVDVAYAEMHQGTDPDEVVLMQNLGGGTSWRKQVLSTQGSHDIVAADFGNDGDLDLVGANHGGSFQPLEMWRNESGAGSGMTLDSWARRIVDSSRPATAVFVFPADLDGDGDKDVVAGGWWYRNPGTVGGAWARNTIGSPLNNVAAVYDFDGDGDLDLFGTQGTGSAANHNFAWARNSGTGTFTVLVNIATGGTGDFLQGVAADRYASGGPIEIALSWHNGGGGVHMLTVPADPSSGTWSFRTLSTSTQDEQLSSGDIDRDGDKDLLLGTQWLRNNGTSWSLHTLFGNTGAPDRNRLADLNRDGRLDAVVGYEAISVQGKLAWYAQPATATDAWAENVISTTVVGPMSLDVADFDGDGDLDVVVGEHNLSNPASARLLLFENRNGAGTSWLSHTVYTGDEHHDGAQAADLDGDGDLDLVSVGWGHPRVHAYENLARTGGTPPPPPPAAPTGLSATAVSSTQINLAWTDASSSESEFRIFRSTSSTTGFVQVGTVGANATSFQDTGLAASTTYYYRVRAANAGGASGDSNTASATTPSGGGGGGSVPSSGLQLWLKADAGVTQSGGAVSAWADQSGSGRNAAQATAAARPTLISGAYGGLPALQFDGVDDHLTFTLPVNGMTGMTLVLVSACTADRTGGGTNAENAAIFWNETASWGTVYLSPFQTNVKFRFGTTQSGNLPAYARPASIGSAFSTTIAVKGGTTDTLFVNGTQVLSQGGKLGTIAGCRDTGNLGRGYNDNTYFPGRIAELLVYNRALTTAERQGVEQYVSTRYAGAPPPNVAPAVSLASPANGASFTAPATISLAASASDTDGTVTRVEFFQGATKIGEDTSSAGGWTYAWTNVAEGSYSLTARATDDDGATTTSAAVGVSVVASGGGTVPASGLQLWLKADAGVTQSGGTVSAWADQSGNGRNAVQAAAAARPAWIASDPGGKPVLHFDGVDDHLTFTLPVNGMTGMTLVLVSACLQNRTGGGTNAESAAIFWNETASWGTVYLSPFQTNVKFRFGTTQSGNLPAYTRPASIGSAYSTSIGVKSGATDTLYVNGAQVLSQGGKLGSIAGCRDTGNLGRGYNDNTYFPGRIAEVLVYNRALSTSERQGIEQYLAGRYPGALPAVASAAAGAPAGGPQLTAASTSSGAVPLVTTAAPGALPYLDRSTSIQELSAGLAGGALIRLANDDKDATAADHVRITLAEAATLFVGIDPRASPLPAWLNAGGWSPGSGTLVLSDAGASPMLLFSRTFPAGDVQLGGPEGAPSAYVLIAVSASPRAAAPPDAWTHPDDSDGDGLVDSFEMAYGLDPGSPDSDGDGVVDEGETDGSGRTYWQLQAAGTLPTASGGSACGALGAEVLLALLAFRRRPRVLPPEA